MNNTQAARQHKPELIRNMKNRDAKDALFASLDGERKDIKNVYWLANSLWIIRATGAQTAGKFTIIERIFDKNAICPPHTHPVMSEFIHMIEGRLNITVEGESHKISAGGFIHIPHNTEHFMEAVGDANCRLLNMYSPPGIEDAIIRHAEKL